MPLLTTENYSGLPNSVIKYDRCTPFIYFNNVMVRALSLVKQKHILGTEQTKNILVFFTCLA